ncbi:putative nickel-responsive regulator [Pseudodesulfovibrio profundus]|uniref:Putative nickel-responsive regulator n=1 Tax=Pseudodesulfovibrio profundus TaxID=57320 RepID=A0A2C8F731_9BACT|nr:nickel-responsive transcriptional regulator NikR [Pseudodesulfovibrio profundus]MBC18044.1 nickel-responsive transcriptional regulator NikR [Desulfovibrio sp.]SOB57647.1 putative nickel-responsive regulator [Pseudodesulfovibrio profundus]|tara:strand:+ start:1275 stop:1694 length:420 start_codon:yes stop_codon:yes gene_type:complete
MGKTIRFGVSLDSDLLEKFDTHCEERSYQTRSEAIRDLIRNTLVQREWEQAEGDLAGTLTLVYDHHKSGLSQRLTEIQHDAHDVIQSSLHVHLDHHNCLEVIILKGDADTIKDLGQKLISTKGVKHGNLALTTTGRDLI